MPDHVHLFAAFPIDGITLPSWIKSLRSVIGKTLLGLGAHKPHWQALAQTRKCMLVSEPPASLAGAERQRRVGAVRLARLERQRTATLVFSARYCRSAGVALIPASRATSPSACTSLPLRAPDTLLVSALALPLRWLALGSLLTENINVGGLLRSSAAQP